jgi:succinyl-CoA synthetase alpha subunit
MIMKQGVKLSKAAKIKIAQRICTKYAEGIYTLDSCCKNESISDRTFYTWINDHSEISELYKEAQKKADEIFKKNLKEKAKTALEKLIEGYESIETFQEGIPGKNKGEIITTKVTTRKRFVGPNATTVIFTLTNTDSANFKHKSETELKGKIEIDNLSKVSDEELEKRIKELENKQK